MGLVRIQMAQYQRVRITTIVSNLFLAVILNSFNRPYNRPFCGYKYA